MIPPKVRAVAHSHLNRGKINPENAQSINHKTNNNTEAPKIQRLRFHKSDVRHSAVFSLFGRLSLSTASFHSTMRLHCLENFLISGRRDRGSLTLHPAVLQYGLQCQLDSFSWPDIPPLSPSSLSRKGFFRGWIQHCSSLGAGKPPFPPTPNHHSQTDLSHSRSWLEMITLLR